MPTATYKRRSRHTPSGLELPRCDGRTLAARRYRALCVAFEQELGGDLGIVDQNLIRQAAGLVLASERFQDAAVSGAEINLDALVRVSSEARRILGMLRGKSDKRQAASGQDALAAHIAAKYGHRFDGSSEVDIEDDDAAEEIAAVAE